jgi:hypothetical protein
MSSLEVGTRYAGSPDSVQITWPRAGTEVFLERLGRLGPAKDRHA